MKYVTRKPTQTQAIAAELAATLTGGECIVLFGDLGAGKTQFVRGLLEGLGGNPRSVCSPTYMLLNCYDSGRLNLYHLDAYRVAGAEDFQAIGFTELLEQGGIVAVEWPQRIAQLLPPQRIEVRLVTKSLRVREVTVERVGYPEAPWGAVIAHS